MYSILTMNTYTDEFTSIQTGIASERIISVTELPKFFLTMYVLSLGIFFKICSVTLVIK